MAEAATDVAKSATCIAARATDVAESATSLAAPATGVAKSATSLADSRVGVTRRAIGAVGWNLGIDGVGPVDRVRLTAVGRGRLGLVRIKVARGLHLNVVARQGGIETGRSRAFVRQATPEHHRQGWGEEPAGGTHPLRVAAKTPPSRTASRSRRGATT
jgi:hypothetical protein